MRQFSGSLALGAALLVCMPARANDSPQIRQGAELYEEKCALCHGANGRGGQGYPNPIWGAGSQIKKFKTAQGLFEYHQLMMPFNDPTLLDDQQKMAVTAFVLANHGAMERGDTLDLAKATQITIP
jgi:S-disulfanyl-L-cysteine oxidoreductase SoxD